MLLYANIRQLMWRHFFTYLMLSNQVFTHTHTYILCHQYSIQLRYVLAENVQGVTALTLLSPKQHFFRNNNYRKCAKIITIATFYEKYTWFSNPLQVLLKLVFIIKYWWLFGLLIYLWCTGLDQVICPSVPVSIQMGQLSLAMPPWVAQLVPAKVLR